MNSAIVFGIWDPPMFTPIRESSPSSPVTQAAFTRAQEEDEAGPPEQVPSLMCFIVVSSLRIKIYVPGK